MTTPLSSDASGPTAAVPAGPLEIGPNCWLVGRRNPKSLLQCNTYLRVFDDGKSPRRVCIDPGSRFDISAIRRNICELIGSLSEVDAFTLNHQDPDVVGNSPCLCEANPDIAVTVSEDVWRLVQHLGFKPGRVHFANPARSGRTDEQGPWQLVPTPFCHFRGAMAFYDPEIRTLFSGDLFGGLNQLGRVHLAAEEADWGGVAQFHQIYMPTREVLRYAIRQIRALKPAVGVIAPQHGHVITGDLVGVFLERMHELLVGTDLLAVELDESYLNGYRHVLARLIAEAEQDVGKDDVLRLLKTIHINDGLHRLVRIAGDDVILESEGYSAIVKVLARLTLGNTSEYANRLRSAVLAGCTEQGLPIPPIGVGVEKVVTPGDG